MRELILALLLATLIFKIAHAEEQAVEPAVASAVVSAEDDPGFIDKPKFVSYLSESQCEVVATVAIAALFGVLAVLTGANQHDQYNAVSTLSDSASSLCK